MTAPLVSQSPKATADFVEPAADKSITALEWTPEQRRNIAANLARLGASDLVDMLTAPLIGGAR